jgi:diguanylate cyclase (GGDEF)-like protein
MDKDNRTTNLIALNVGKSVIIAAIYFLASLIGGIFRLNGATIPIIWPQAGVALVAVLLLGYTSLPGVFLGSLIIALATGVQLQFSVINAFGNMLAVYIPVYFIFQQRDFSKLLNNYVSIFLLVLFGVIVGPLISAAISIMGMYFLQLTPIGLLPSIMGNRWLRDALGVLVFTPVLLVWIGNPFPRLKKEQIIEGLAIFLAVIGLILFLFIGEIPSDVVYSIFYLVIALIIFASVRNEIHVSILINFITALIFLWGIAHSQGSSFNSSTPSYRIYLYMISIMLITSLIISTSVAIINDFKKNLSYLSTHDTLTGLYNRLFFETEIERLENSRQFPISVIMADIDGLKDINDTFGHSTGDQVLVNLANLLSDVFRQEDIVSRLGGDEFVILLPNTDASITKKIIKRIEKQNIAYNKRHMDLPLNFSMGISTAKQGESLEEHLKNADNLMYEEKQKRKREIKT